MGNTRPAELRSWAVVHTQPQRETLAREHLGRQNFESYCPMIKKQRRIGRRVMDVLRPLFPSYVFVRVEPGRDQWRPVLSTIGVRKLLRFGDQLGFINGHFIENLKARELDGLIPIPGPQFEIGQRVQLTDGPFDGLIAKIVAIDERDRVVVLMELMSRHVQVKVGSHQLTAA